MSEITAVVLTQPAITVTPVGQGLQGARGPAGAGARYEHLQTTASAAWVVNHNLGYRPSVQVLSLGGMAMLAEVLHSSDNQVRVYFDTPTAGLALCG